MVQGAPSLPKLRAGIEMLVAGMGAGMEQQADAAASLGDRLTALAQQTAAVNEQVGALGQTAEALTARDAARDRRDLDARLGLMDAVRAGGQRLRRCLRMRTSPRTSSRSSVRSIERRRDALSVVTTGLEHAIADVFAAFEAWLVSTGATASMLRLAWAVLTALWLGHVAVESRPGRQFDLIEVFGRLLIAGGLLTAVGPLTQVIVTGFDTLRDAGAAVLQGLIGQSWAQFVRALLGPQMTTLFGLVGPWFTYPWALTLLAVGLLCGVVLFAIGVMVYLAILFFAYLTLLLAIFLAPLALALLAAPATQRWTARWAVVVVRTGLVVFCVRVIHAATLYLAVIAPVRGVMSGFQQGCSHPAKIRRQRSAGCCSHSSATCSRC